MPLEGCRRPCPATQDENRRPRERPLSRPTPARTLVELGGAWPILGQYLCPLTASRGASWPLPRFRTALFPIILSKLRRVRFPFSAPFRSRLEDGLEVAIERHRPVRVVVTRCGVTPGVTSAADDETKKATAEFSRAGAARRLNLRRPSNQVDVGFNLDAMSAPPIVNGARPLR